MKIINLTKAYGVGPVVKWSGDGSILICVRSFSSSEIIKVQILGMIKLMQQRPYKGRDLLNLP